MRRTLERLRAGADKEMKGLASMLDGVNGVMDGYQREMRETLRGWRDEQRAREARYAEEIARELDAKLRRCSGEHAKELQHMHGRVKRLRERAQRPVGGVGAGLGSFAFPGLVAVLVQGLGLRSRRT